MTHIALKPNVVYEPSVNDIVAPGSGDAAYRHLHTLHHGDINPRGTFLRIHLVVACPSLACNVCYRTFAAWSQ